MANPNADVTTQLNESINTVTNYKDIVVNYIVENGFKILFSIILLIVGMKLIKYLIKLMSKLMDRSKVDESLKVFLLSFSNIALKLLLIIMVITTLGADTTSIAAVVGGASLAIGLAFQGSLSNFAGGVLILLLKPFKIGDYVSEGGSGYEGTVEAIDIFYTKLRTKDNKIIMLPNGNLSNNNLVNYTAKPTRRIDLQFSIGYNDDIIRTKVILLDILEKHKLILENPEPKVVVTEHADSSINLAIWAWTNTSNYIEARYDLIEQVKLRFDKEGINIPYPQMDVHIVSDNNDK